MTELEPKRRPNRQTRQGAFENAERQAYSINDEENQRFEDERADFQTKIRTGRYSFISAWATG